MERIFYIFLVILGIFILGVQVGIHHGRNLEDQEYYSQIPMEVYVNGY